MTETDLPNAQEAEQALLGAMLIAPEIVREVTAQVDAGHFYLSKHAEIFMAIADLVEAGRNVDLLLVQRALADRGKEIDTLYVASLPNITALVENWRGYAQEILRTYKLRRWVVAGHQIAREAAFGGDPDLLEARMRALLEGIPQQTGAVAVRDILVSEVLHPAEEAARKGTDGISGVPYGFPNLDAATGGQHPGELILVVALTSVGKSALAGQLWEHAARTRGPAVLCANEMLRAEYARRVVARAAQIEPVAIRSGRFQAGEFERLAHVSAAISELPLFIADKVHRVQEIRRALYSVPGTKWACVDWLQLLSEGGHEGQTAELDSLVKQIKGIAQEFMVPVVLVSQGDKASAVRGKVGMGSARGSYMIDQAADVAITINQDDKQTIEEGCGWTGQLRIVKSRNGRLATQKVIYMAKQTYFVTQETHRQEPKHQEPAYVPGGIDNDF